jgi:ATP-dependent Clp protease ATP-binding subunit ClpC
MSALSAIPYLVAWDGALLASAPAEVLGRELPLERLTRAILRRTDPVVMVLGEAGCGKTGLVRGLARAALEGRIPALADYTFAQLDVPQILTAVVLGKIGTSALIDTLVQVSRLPKTVLVVDDLHLLSGQPGATPLVNDMTACFRPLLASGGLRAILTSTPKEYETKLASDPLYSRRVSLLYVEELAGNLLRTVVREAARSLAEHHGVTIGDAAIDEAVTAAGHHTIPYRPPGSSLRLLDDACAQAVARGHQAVDPTEVKEAARTHVEAALVWDRPRLRGLEETLSERVLGQPEAVSAVARRLRVTKLQLDRKPQRPDGVFLFLGPSGVGKTELAKALAQVLYGDLNRLVRLDMSEYMEQHEYSKMIGSPPGYLGYGEEGHLTGAVAKLGHCVILFDEVEKAHPNCLRLFLQLFDEGVLTDGKGKRVDFSQCVIAMTSNLGRELWADENQQLGFARALSPGEPSAKRVLEYLLKTLPSEFVNRIDDLVPFRNFLREDLLRIARKMMKEEEERWERRGKRIAYGEPVLELLVDTGYNARLGARHLSRNLERLVSQPLSEAACQDSWPEIQKIEMRAVGQAVEMDFTPSLAAPQAVA